MERSEALKITSEFIEAIQVLKKDGVDKSISIERGKRLEEEIKKQKSENSVLKKYRTYFNLLSSVCDYEICKCCDGAGAFHYDMGEQGGVSEMCGECEGSGIIKKVNTQP